MEVGGQAKDRERILKSGGLLNLVMKEKGEKPFLHEVPRVQRRVVDTRGQELLHAFIDTPVAQPAIGAEELATSLLRAK
jgi:hypothetical protein